MIEIIPLIVLALASFRLTRFLVIDTLTEGPRNKFHSFLVNKIQKENKFFHLLWNKIYELTSCTWCAGFWVTAALYAAMKNGNQYVLYAIDIFAIAGAQGLLHAYEPGDE